MTNIHVVRGYVDEYEDDHSWLVAAYLDESLALEHATNAEKRVKEIWGEASQYYTRRDIVEKAHNEYDPNMSRVDISHYEVMSVRIMDLVIPVRSCESCGNILPANESELCAKCKRALRIES